jgi:hypothetical protein
MGKQFARMPEALEHMGDAKLTEDETVREEERRKKGALEEGKKPGEIAGEGEHGKAPRVRPRGK